jgi:hypothetical protein
MQRADEPTVEVSDAASCRSSRSPVSVAILAGIACVPIVVAAGFLTDRPAGGAATAVVPGDIAVLALRGPLDAAAPKRPDLPVRAGY